MTTGTVISKDGTRIAYESLGSGPGLVLVDGALCYRASGPARPLAERLADRFTVYIYDRRGRGESGDAPEYDVQREVEDLEGVLAEAGGAQACVYGISSGAMIALETANRGVALRKLALYETPIVVDDTREPIAAEYDEHLRALIEAGRNGAAVKYFMRAAVGLPAPLVTLFPLMPAWGKLKRVAPTLIYDARTLDGMTDGRPVPEGRFAAVAVPTLAIYGGKSPQWMKNAVRQIADAVPGARPAELPGQTHMVKPAVLAPMLADFFAS
jgi:pimeloyl-ACP methyl ester carboxylesterase